MTGWLMGTVWTTAASAAKSNAVWCMAVVSMLPRVDVKLEMCRIEIQQGASNREERKGLKYLQNAATARVAAGASYWKHHNAFFFFRACFCESIIKNFFVRF